MVTTLTLSRGSTTYGDGMDTDQLPDIALNFTMLSGIIISEGILVVCLVIQFMSSFDYLTGFGKVILIR